MNKPNLVYDGSYKFPFYNSDTKIKHIFVTIYKDGKLISRHKIKNVYIDNTLLLDDNSELRIEEFKECE